MAYQPVSFAIDDVKWIAHEARQLWTDGAPESTRRFRDLLACSPTAQFSVPAEIDLAGEPFGERYKDEILKLWKLIRSADEGNESTEYDPTEHEQDASYAACPIRFPGFFARRDSMAINHAAYELAMIADILRAAGIQPGEHCVEYGAGSGNVAITLSRLGVIVDTVDISPTYCDHIQRNADFFGIELKPFNQAFGFDPSEGQFKYKAIVFHACFHHALEHVELVSKLAAMLADDGVILLSNEPIERQYYCPWGLRRDPESISVIAARGWMELGFDLNYLTRLFYFNGLGLTQVPENFSGIALFAARKLSTRISFALGSCLCEVIVGAHQPESDGLWTCAESLLPVSHCFGSRRLAIELANHFPVGKRLVILIADRRHDYAIEANSTQTIALDISDSNGIAATTIAMQCETHRAVDFFPGSRDDRELGIFLRSVSFE